MYVCTLKTSWQVLSQLLLCSHPSMEDSMKKQTNLQKLLQLLKDGQWHVAEDLAQYVSFRFGHTVYEARKKGYKIQKRRVAHNLYEYCWQN